MQIGLFVSSRFVSYNIRMIAEQDQLARAGNEQYRKNPYKEYLPGDNLAFTLKTLRPDGSIEETEKEITIAEVKGGGFFGRVLIPEEESFVIKTSLPGPWHHFWRVINWDFGDLPARESERQIQLEHLSGRIIHETLPVITDGKFKAPGSLGYTTLATGNALILEKMHGRVARFDTKDDEPKKFVDTQHALTKFGFAFGLEHAGQVHPDNPFGRTNVWYDPVDNTFIWLDNNAAMPHTGFVWPGFYFSFHDDVRKRFYGKNFPNHPPTFNTIHTARFFAELYNNRSKFPPEVFEEVKGDLRLYRKLWEQAQTEPVVIDRKRAVEALVNTTREIFTENVVYNLLSNTDYRREKLETIVRLIKDPDSRTLFYNENFVLRGIESARKDGIITEKEWMQAWKAVEEYEGDPKRKWVLSGLQAYYLIVKGTFDAYELGMYATAPFSENPLLQTLFALVSARLAPPVARVAGTLVFQKATGVDLKTAAYVSATPVIPFVGTVFPIPAQVAVTEGQIGEGIWHSTVRDAVTTASKFHPAGGRGSKLEHDIWKRVGQKIEKMGKPKITENGEASGKS